jgi:hypothetical protein
MLSAVSGQVSAGVCEVSAAYTVESKRLCELYDPDYRAVL